VYNTVITMHKEFDKSFFKKWTRGMAYVLGFLFADGNIIKTKRKTYFISIYSSDEDLLGAMRECMRSNHKISLRKSLSGSVYRIQIGSKGLFNDLVKKGLTPNKSRRMRMPRIPKRYFGDFVRGYFDGDGNVWVGFLNKKRENPTYVITTSFTCASKAFLQSLQAGLIKEGVRGGSVYKIMLPIVI
jgi:intein-encoded DNA endonuclease-like protein